MESGNSSAKFDRYGFICNEVSDDQEEVGINAEDLEMQWDSIIQSSETVLEVIRLTGRFKVALKEAFLTGLEQSSGSTYREVMFVLADFQQITFKYCPAHVTNTHCCRPL